MNALIVASAASVVIAATGVIGVIGVIAAAEVKANVARVARAGSMGRVRTAPALMARVRLNPFVPTPKEMFRDPSRQFSSRWWSRCRCRWCGPHGWCPPSVLSSA
ncbi:hypothetical protein WCLP8_2990003 [uncultured Gammaproteobacteria bacterium]